jgi:hypothetical protein
MISKKSVERLVILRLLIAALLPDRGRQAAEVARLVGDRNVDAAGMAAASSLDQATSSQRSGSSAKLSSGRNRSYGS